MDGCTSVNPSLSSTSAIPEVWRSRSDSRAGSSALSWRAPKLKASADGLWNMLLFLLPEPFAVGASARWER